MGAVECLDKLKAAGFKALDIIGVLGVTAGKLARLEAGEALSALDERHVISNYLAFAKRARLWNARPEA
jgi:hypothetical protein